MTTTVKDKVQKVLADFGYPDLNGAMEANGVLVIDGDPHRVFQAANKLASAGATLVMYENGDDLDDEDFHGWGFARIQIG